MYFFVMAQQPLVGKDILIVEEGSVQSRTMMTSTTQLEKSLFL
jgi:hypothetical protein